MNIALDIKKINKQIEEAKQEQLAKEARVSAIMKIAQEYSSQLTQEERDFDWDKYLYDEMGLPK